MNAVCCAPNCTNSSRKGFVLVRFPRDESQKTKWVEAIGRSNWRPTITSRLCEAHFHRSEWIKPRDILRRDAVPSVFLKGLKTEGLTRVTDFSLRTSLVPSQVKSRCSLKMQSTNQKRHCGYKYCRFLENHVCLLEIYNEEKNITNREKIIEFALQENDLLRTQINLLKEALSKVGSEQDQLVF